MGSAGEGDLGHEDGAEGQTGVLLFLLPSERQAGQGGVITTAPQAWALFHPAQSPNPAMSGPSSPTLAPTQLCSRPPPAAPAAGPKARPEAADTTIQLKFGLEPKAGGGL